jgi:hypothetical protein
VTRSLRFLILDFGVICDKSGCSQSLRGQVLQSLPGQESMATKRTAGDEPVDQRLELLLSSLSDTLAEVARRPDAVAGRVSQLLADQGKISPNLPFTKNEGSHRCGDRRLTLPV